MPDTSQAQLQRLLHVFAMASQKGGASLSELARACNVTKAQILADLGQATARAFYHPAGDGGTLQIIIEEEHVEVWAGDHFRRPIRLSRKEALALGVGLRILAAEVDSPERERRLALAARLESALAVPDVSREAAPRVRETVAAAAGAGEAAGTRAAQTRAGEPHITIEIDGDAGPLDVELGHDQFRGLLFDAIRERRRVRILYLKPGDVEPRVRTLEPARLVYAIGRWYLLARDTAHEGVRVYRLDRILEAHMDEQRFTRPAVDITNFLDEGGRLHSGGQAIRAKVRYSPKVARWIRERTGAPADANGYVTLEHRVSDADWLVRHVFQYGAEAQVLEPPELRAHVARAALRLGALTEPLD